jgi:tetratricopeptide (TPR) repeat protein
MLSIFATTDVLDKVKMIIAQEDRLNEWVSVKDFLIEKPKPSAYNLIIKKEGIRQPIDWFNVLPPYILAEEIPLTPAILLGFIFFKLGNIEKAYECFSKNKALLNEIDIINCLQNGIPVNPEVLATEYSEFDEYRLMHNNAILRHYAAEEDNFDADKIRYFYREAMNVAPNDEYKAFTAKHLATFLTDMQDLDHAENILLAAENYALSNEAKTELKSALVAVWMKKLVVPYDKALLNHVKTTLWDVLQVYEKQGRALEIAMTLVDASYIANISDSFSESLGYISRAIDIFKEEQATELLANAQYRKGTLLYTWAKNGNPQFLKGAMDAYQQALKVFNREDTPLVFADIQHHLGVIYSEIPDEIKKKGIWASVSSSAFNEALNFYTREEYPYEYAAVCNSFGNAMTKYPQAIHTDNYEKALYYYQIALEIRTADKYPIERSLTLLNYLEASWNAGVGTKDSDTKRFQDMITKAKEVKTLTNDPKVLEEANVHLEKLEALEKVIF